ncbi:MAG: tetratricopeptide repeat protein [Candidatus Eremiobacteraeota bacterium]|nr:tetratricopeptide repeat protein [Candidatus Eremiobacteraeota bacterium]
MLKSGKYIVALFLIIFFLANYSIAVGAYTDEKTGEYIRKGDNFILEKKYKEALEEYKKALEMNEEEPVPHYKMGLAYYFLSDYDKAVLHYKRALKLDPNYVKAMNNLALIYEKQDNDAESLMLYKKAVELKPRYLKARYNLGALLITMKKLDAAEEQARKIIEISPKYYKAFFLLGLIHEYRKEYRKSEGMYLKCLSLNARFRGAVNGMKRVRENIAATSGYQKELKKAQRVVHFEVPPGYRFVDISDVLSGGRIIRIRYEDDQDIFIVRLRDPEIIAKRDTETLMNNIDSGFSKVLGDMKISALEISGMGVFRQQEKDKKDKSLKVKEKDESPEKKSGKDDSGKDDSGKDDSSQDAGKPKFEKTRKYAKIKCLFKGIDSEGIIVVFRPSEKMDPMLFISLASPDKFSLRAARKLYDEIGQPENE